MASASPPDKTKPDTKVKIYSADPDTIDGKDVEDVANLTITKSYADKYHNPYWLFSSTTGKPTMVMFVVSGVTVSYAAPYDDPTKPKKDKAPAYQLGVRFGDLTSNNAMKFIRWQSLLHTIVVRYLKECMKTEEDEDKKAEYADLLQDFKSIYETDTDGKTTGILKKYTRRQILSKQKASATKKGKTPSEDAKLGIFVTPYPWGEGTSIYKRKESGKVSKYRTNNSEEAEDTLKTLFTKGCSATATITLLAPRIIKSKLGIACPLQLFSVILESDPEQFTMSKEDRAVIDGVIGERDEDIDVPVKKSGSRSKKTITEDEDDDEPKKKPKKIQNSDEEPEETPVSKKTAKKLESKKKIQSSEDSDEEQTSTKKTPPPKEKTPSSKKKVSRHDSDDDE